MNRFSMRFEGLMTLLLLSLVMPVQAGVSQVPLFLTQTVDPRVMLMMSNDHQLSIKAYTDYSDLDNDGLLDTSYKDSIEYTGYFNPDNCYSYSFSTGNDRFIPAASVDTGTHQCTSSTSHWSGNFLNWATMTRMDMVRWVLYGGKRSTDTSSLTVLERSFLPYDVHAFAKVFTSADMNKYTPYSDASITLCNVTEGSGRARTSTAAPLIKVASGSWPRWAAQEVKQCQWGSGGRPATTDELTNSPFTARVQVCGSSLRASNCQAYGSSYKPTGLLQEYGEDTNSRPIRFGLITGSYDKNKSGGVLRRNLERITGNTTSSKNEINTADGTFINQGTSDEGIINTLSRIRISSYDFDDKQYKENCNSPGITSFANGECVDWGNPISEIYLETLRYLAGKNSATSAFNADDKDHIDDLTTVSWIDPMPSDEHCADTSIIALSTGLNSFDTDELSNDLGIDVTVYTNKVGTAEGISGQYLVGKGSVTDDQQCTGKTVNNLADVEGVCPEVPSMEGGYHIAGLAYHARVVDQRSDRSNDQKLTTYGVSLAESLPSFEVSAGSSKVSILPACNANSTGTAALSDSGWRYCSMTDLIVEYQDATEGKFLINWEDSTWGNDYDMDGIARMEYCVGKTCSNTDISNDNSVADTDIRVRISAVQANAGHALAFGYTITGTTNDGFKRLVLRPGGSNFNEGDSLPSGVTPAVTTTYVAGTSSAGQLKNPLWYTAKYGGFNDSDSDNLPDLASEWDEDGDGTPDTFFQVTNPGELVTELGKVFSDVAARDASASAVTTNSTRLNTATVAFQAIFNSAEWNGQLMALPISSNGTVGSVVWDAADNVPAHGNRKILAWDPSGLKGYEFNTTTANSTKINAKVVSTGATALTDDQINYLRGDGSKESDQTGGSFRERPAPTGKSPLGDIVNSDPLFVAQPNFGYQRLDSTEGTSYLDFRTSSTYVDRPSMLYVGGNDGMLHAFSFKYNATTGTATGEEKFAFVPNAVFGNLGALTSSPYSHQFYVDGSPAFGDAYIDHNHDGAKNWRTVLVGTTGAGGSGVFTLDITEPDDSGLTSGEKADQIEDMVLWDIDNTTSGFSDLGYTIGQAAIARFEDGKYYAVFGNGYNSSSGKAVLYMVQLDDLSNVHTFDTQTTVNGMSSPVVVDKDGDRIADYIYAGDLKGNLWKLDVSGNVSQWGFAFKQGSTPKPLFTATDSASPSVVQPIMAKPNVGEHEDGGLMVYFGTGKYFESADNTSSGSQIQTFYAVRDQGSEVAGRSELQVQSIEKEDTVTFAGSNLNVRVTSNNTVNYASKKGWYMDLILAGQTVGTGERIINKAILRGERVIFTTLTPSTDPCSYGGSSWLMEINALTGSRLDSTPFDANGDGKFDDNDKVAVVVNGETVLIPVSGVQNTELGIHDNPAIVEDGTKEIKVMGGSSGNVDTMAESKANDGGRLSWQQLQ
ncbi:pilus assembly protein [Motiliproteus sp.]|uniref:pilus assembly protein n=1 Tax=Motiliproteus sp. TaxID=1898955 RepID=UPI003BA8D6BD